MTINPGQRFINLTFFVGLAISFVLLAFSPLLSFFISIVFIFLSQGSPNYIGTKILVFIAVLSVSIITASRGVALVESDDIIRYYDLYINIFNDSYLDLNVEIGLTLVYKFLYIILGDITIQFFLFIHCFIITIIFVFYLYRLIAIHPVMRKNNTLAISLLLFSFPLTTQIFRYFLSIILLLICSTYTNKVIRYTLTLFAFFFHLASPFLWLAYKIVSRLHVLLFILATPFIFYLTINFHSFASIIIETIIPGVSKLDYALNTSGFDGPSIGSILVVFLVFSAFILTNTHKLLKAKEITVVYFYALSLSLLTLPIALMPFRILFPFTTTINGIIISAIISIYNRTIQIRIFFLLFMYKLISMSGFSNNEVYSLWISYPALDLIPFYYLFIF